jgi:hypothetical protein
MLRRTLLTAFAAVVLVANANAATVTLQMMKDTNGPGTYELRARSSAGDNGGLASFNIPLLDILTLTNESPFYTLNATNFQPGGFSELRVPATDNNTTVKEVFASQRLVPTPTPNLEYGFGQTAGDWAASEYVAAAPSRRPAWQDNLLLASGTYATGADPRPDMAATALSILVFDDATGPEAIAATVELQGGGPTAPILDDVALGQQTMSIIRHTFVPGAGSGPITSWSIAPTTGSPAVAATISQTGQFEWHTIGSQRSDPPGTPYSWTITAAGEGGTSDTAVLSLNLVVPEPATMSLFGIAMVGLVGFARRRG